MNRCYGEKHDWWDILRKDKFATDRIQWCYYCGSIRAKSKNTDWITKDCCVNACYAESLGYALLQERR